MVLVAALAAWPPWAETVIAQEAPVHVTATTADGVTIHGERYVGGVTEDAPLVLLFHQGGSSGRGEYAPLAGWLNGLGYRAVAWDLRAGGETHGVPNRTVDGLAEGVPDGFCDAYPDLVAALDHVVRGGWADRVVLWGSSFSGALVFRLAAEHPDRVSGVVAFSPASGGPMADCRARPWLDRLSAPAAVFRPAGEMDRESSVEQRNLMTAADVSFFVVENGVHGSSMLVDARTGADMADARETVAAWLDGIRR